MWASLRQEIGFALSEGLSVVLCEDKHYPTFLPLESRLVCIE